MEHGLKVGMSGGVDSSVAALILQRQGCAVTGVTLRLRGDRPAASTGAGAAAGYHDDARRVWRRPGHRTPGPRFDRRLLPLRGGNEFAAPNIWPAALPTPA
ncbi:MAG: hypothetical protein ACLU9S_04185 [Oscillospiraceae bacterium]